jgi:hypothetical protein
MLNGHLRIPGPGVPYGVIKGFLNQPIDTDSVFVGQIFRHVLRFHGYFDLAAAGHFPTLPFQRSHQAKVVEHGWTKQERDISYRQ